MNTRDGRFSTDELNQVISNWETIANEYQGKFKLTKVITDSRNPLYQKFNKENIDHNELYCYRINVAIPFLKKYILISSDEFKMPKFEYELSVSDFYFIINNEDLFDKITKFLGQKDVQTGEIEFDKKFLFDTDNIPKLKEFLDLEIRKWLETLKIGFFDLNSQKSKDKLSIYFSINEFSTDNISEQIEMFKYCISKLKNICEYNISYQNK